MISVVVCSINENLAQQIKSNIDKTIGVPWEAIILDNRNPSRSITAVYNEGAKRARYPYICFVHEDISFISFDWGKKIIRYFNDDPQLGMVGVAGSAYKSKTLSGWMTFIPEFDRCNIYHLDKDGRNTRLYFDQPPALALKPVVTLDGVFLCSTREILNSIPFDQRLLKGFHLYDLDISFRISQSFKVAVSFEIDIIHYTEGGDFGNNWVKNTMLWHKKYGNEFPASTDDKALNHNRHYEFRVCRFWLNRLRTEKISWSNKWNWVLQSGALLRPGLWPHVLIFLFSKPVDAVLRRREKSKSGETTN